MDLFEYILETMNYNLYTEDYLYESIDIKKIGSNIKEYIVRFFKWLRKKITEAFEKLKSKFSKKGSSNDKKDLPKDDEILKTVDVGDLGDDEKEQERQEDDEQPKKEQERQEDDEQPKKEQERQEDDEQPKKEQERQERNRREREALNQMKKREGLNQMKKESDKKVEKYHVTEMINDLTRIQENIKKKGGFDNLTKQDIFNIRHAISDLKRNKKGYEGVGGNVKAKRRVDDQLKMIIRRLSTIQSNNTHEYVITDLDNLEDIIDECRDIIEKFQDKSRENIEKLSEYISSTNEELDERLSRADKRISENHSFKTEEDLIRYTEKFKANILQDLNRDQATLENKYNMRKKEISSYNESQRGRGEKLLKIIEASISMYARIYKVVVQIVPYAKLKEDK